MVVTHSKSATKHRISRERSTYVVHNAIAVVDIGAPVTSPTRSPRTLHLGPDSQGVMLEVISVEGRRGDVFVIHAMPMRPRYRSLTDPIH